MRWTHAERDEFRIWIDGEITDRPASEARAKQLIAAWRAYGIDDSRFRVERRTVVTVTTEGPAVEILAGDL